MSEIVKIAFIACGGAFGAYFRYQFSIWLMLWFGKNFPYGTLFVNVVGSFIMGLVMAAIGFGYLAHHLWSDAIATGFLGALTTFSTFSWETYLAFSDGQISKAFLNILLNVFLSLFGVSLGFAIINLF